MVTSLVNSGAVLSKIGRDIDRRNKTDIRIFPSMVFAILALYTFIALYRMISSGTDLADLFSIVRNGNVNSNMFTVVIVGTGLTMAVMFVLASRTFRHNRRDAALMSDVCSFFECMLPDGADDPDVKRMRSYIYLGIKQEVLFITFFIALVPAVVAVLIYLCGLTSDPDLISKNLLLFSFFFSLLVVMLNIDFSKAHEDKFIGFSDTCVDVMMKLGISMKGYSQVIGYRKNFTLVLLCVVTLGIFIIVWLCIAMRDFNRHMDEQWNFENNLFQALKILKNRGDSFNGIFGV